MTPPGSVPEVTLGVYLDKNVSFADAGEILDSIKAKFPTIEIVWIETWEPTCSDVDCLMRAIYKKSLKGADKVLGLVETPVGVMVAFFFIPVKLGATEAINYDKAVSYTITPIAVHEVKHLLGWRHCGIWTFMKK
jgi:hypothetical protein